MLQVYPERFAELPSQQLDTMLQTLEYGLNAADTDALQSALEALAALANYDFQCKEQGKPTFPDKPGMLLTLTCCVMPSCVMPSCVMPSCGNAYEGVAYVASQGQHRMYSIACAEPHVQHCMCRIVCAALHVQNRMCSIGCRV